MADLTSGTTETNGSSQATASVTPTANRLILAVCANRSTSGDAAVTTATGNGLTWVSIATLIFGESGNNRVRLTIFRSMGASPSAGAITFDAGGTTQETWGWSITEFAGIDTGGTNGSAAVVQSATQQETSSVTTSTVTLAAFGSANNATFGVIGRNKNNESFTPGSGFTEIHDLTTASESLGVATEWRNDNDTTVDGSWASSVKAGGVAIEIKAVVAALHRGFFALVD
jgi:hypothetical protein